MGEHVGPVVLKQGKLILGEQPWEGSISTIGNGGAEVIVLDHPYLGPAYFDVRLPDGTTYSDQRLDRGTSQSYADGAGATYEVGHPEY